MQSKKILFIVIGIRPKTIQNRKTSIISQKKRGKIYLKLEGRRASGFPDLLFPFYVCQHFQRSKDSLEGRGMESVVWIGC